MEPQRFDDFSRFVAHGISRRRMVAWLSASGLAVGLVGCGTSVTPTDPPPANDPPANDLPPTNPPPPPTEPPPPTSEPVPEVALPPTVEVAPTSNVCPGGQTACGSECVDLLSSELHCGSCRISCMGEQTCRGGTCVSRQGDTAECARYGMTKCPGSTTCFDLSSNFWNCGQCGRACEGVWVECVFGECKEIPR
jgi:hypothetical protein